MLGKDYMVYQQTHWQIGIFFWILNTPNATANKCSMSVFLFCFVFCGGVVFNFFVLFCVFVLSLVGFESLLNQNIAYRESD